MRDLFQVVFELKQKEIDDAYKKMDKDKRVIIFHLSNHVYLHIQILWQVFMHISINEDVSNISIIVVI